MKYQIISANQKLIEKLTFNLNLLDMMPSRHIQEVDLYLVDVATITSSSLTSYKNRQTYTKQLFFTNNTKEASFCITHGLTPYLHVKHEKDEFLSWIHHFKQKQTNIRFPVNMDFEIDFEAKVLFKREMKIVLTKQESLLLKELTCKRFVSTSVLAQSLGGKDQTTIRTTINRIRKKVGNGLIVHQRGQGYKLNIDEQKEKDQPLHLHEYVQDLEEQNTLMQQIVDSSPVFIVTFIHEKLYCINASFRAYLGKAMVKELWDETKGDFWQLLRVGEKESLLTKGEHEVTLFTQNNTQNFIVKTFYFEKLDKHLLIFTCK